MNIQDAKVTLNQLKSRRPDRPSSGKDMIGLLEFLIEKVESIPDWVYEYKCCPPGESCCNCD